MAKKKRKKISKIASREDADGIRPSIPFQQFPAGERIAKPDPNDPTKLIWAVDGEEEVDE